jgi:hypothetical protein
MIALLIDICHISYVDAAQPSNEIAAIAYEEME